MRDYLFDDLKSIFHFILGFLTGIFPIWGIGFFTIYLIYELKETENGIKTLGDVLEYGIGVYYGFMLSYILRLIFTF